MRRDTAMVFDEGQEYLVESRLLPLARAAGCADVDAYVARLQTDLAERRRATDALTINETSWFRDRSPYDAFVDVMLPELLKARATQRRIRIWSAAASSGQEAYSLAMLLHENLPVGWRAEITATDVSTAMVARVEAGHYSQIEMNRGMPAEKLLKYFSRAGAGWQVRSDLRDMVTARTLNLAQPFSALPVFDVVLLRNVLIYFDLPTRQAILTRVREHIADDGYLLLGSAETGLDLPAAARLERRPIGRVQTYRPAARPVLPSPIAALTGA